MDGTSGGRRTAVNAPRQVPGLAAAGRQMYAWADGAGLLAGPGDRDRMERTAPDLFIGLCYPQAPPDRLAALCRFAIWSWLVDDALDAHTLNAAQTARAVAELIEELDAQEAARAARAAGPVGEVYGPLYAGRSPAWRQALRAETAAWLGTLVTEANDRDRRRSMTVVEFLAHRRLSSNIQTCMHLAEYASGVDLPSPVREAPALARARELGALWCGLYNDLCSITRDRAEGNQHNAVLVVHEVDGADLRDAVRTVETIAVRTLAAFQAAVRDVPRHSQATQVARAYGTVVRGNYDFHNSRPRYSAPGDTGGHGRTDEARV
ncbi:terpene synthase family protein [Kitasatospora sp. NPDC058965]|uniref:terpene synthase family protein n=1 Tax=Kitasatospora sp. NPDC058965 TaxID=3346682 RepID=UPI0036CADA56